PPTVRLVAEKLGAAASDLQRPQQESDKTQPSAAQRDVQRIKQTLSRMAEGADTTALRAELNQKMDLLATHLTPLLGGVGDSGGRLPNPLTLSTLNDPPVTTPRSADEERIDLNG